MTLKLQRSKNTYNINIPVSLPVNHEEKDLPIHPYVLGVLIGDGSLSQKTNVVISSVKHDVIDRVQKYLGSEYKITKFNTNNHSWGVSYTPKHKMNPLKNTLNSMCLSVTSAYKFIPPQYFLGSIEQRLLLLQGLTDTDGSVDKKGRVSFSSNSIQLIKDVVKLTRSLGYRCTFNASIREDKGIEHEVGISTNKNDIFSSDKHYRRHAERKIPRNAHHYEYQKIVSITPLPFKREMQCISVDSPHHTFICGNYIVTHNTFFQVYVGSYAML